MTTLIQKDTIIEIAVVISDGSLERTIEGPNIAINHPKSVFDGMNDWCIEHHGKSGLTKKCLNSKKNLAKAEKEVLDFLKEHLEKGSAQIAGNSVHVDKAFIMKDMPQLNDFLHYRIVVGHGLPMLFLSAGSWCVC